MKQLCIVLAIILLFMHCKNNEGQEKKVLEIYNQAKQLERKDGVENQLAALKLYDSLIEFEDTKTFHKAKSELLLRGYSIGNSLTSWTIKEMYKLENDALAYFEKNHKQPPVELLNKYNDAWGKGLQMSWEPKKDVLFIIYSPGGDKADSTADDLTLAYRETYTESKIKNLGNFQNEKFIDLDELKLTQDSKNVNETNASLEDIDKLNSKTPTLKEEQIELDELLNKKEK